MTSDARVFIIHENPEWLPPLAAADKKVLKDWMLEGEHLQAWQAAWLAD